MSSTPTLTTSHAQTADPQAKVEQPASPQALLRHRRVTVFTLFVYLSFAVILGGSSSGAPFITAAMQTVAPLVLLPLIWLGTDFRVTPAAERWIYFIVAWMVFALIQALPLPADFTMELPGRDILAPILEVVGPQKWMSISLAPVEALYWVLRFLPVIAVFVLTISVRASDLRKLLPWSVVCLAAASGAVGLLQILLGADSFLYRYAVSNVGSPIGFFANANHQASFCLMAIPFAAILISRGYRDAFRRRGGAQWKFVVPIGLGGLLITTIIVVGSWAGYLMLGPVLVVSGWMVSTKLDRSRLRRSFLEVLGSRRIVVSAGGIAAIALIAAMQFGVLEGAGIKTHTIDEAEVGSRAVIHAKTLEASIDFLPFGSGMGSFPDVYAQYENREYVTDVFVNHAHNEYLELFLEGGVVAVVLMAVGLAMFANMMWAVWGNGTLPDEDSLINVKRAATISVMIVLVHSIVDYPARTMAIAAILAMLVGVLVHAGSQRSARRADEKEELKSVEF